jgi:aromatic ring-cleaving dioxygenase
MHYHAHVYWKDDHQREIAVALREQLAVFGCPLGRIWDHAIGPHPLPMYQVNYDSGIAAAVVGLLSDKGLTVLLHEDTGDDLHDHTHGVRWFGEPLDLDIAWLENYQKEKGLL